MEAPNHALAAASASFADALGALDGAMSRLEIRSARFDDADALASLARTTFCETFVEGFQMNYPHEDLQTFLAESYSLEAVRGWIADTRNAVLVAEGEAGLAAYVQCGDNALPYPGAGPDAGEVKRLYVSHAAQGHGLGRTLLERGLAHLAGREILIGVWSGNHKALRLYDRYGFKAVGAYKFPVGTVMDDELILARAP